jgi:uncharacterized protein
MVAQPVVWFEVVGQNGDVLRAFYGQLFGWTFDTNNPMKYGMVQASNGKGIPGGVGQAEAGMPARTTFYVETPDVAASLETAVKLGGNVLLPRTAMPDVTLGMFRDPEGHVIGLVEARAS